MVVIPNDTQHPYYTRNDLDCMNMLLRPVWVFDIDNKAMFWANNAALEQVWNAETLDELIQRDFASDMSEAAASFLVDLKSRVLQDPSRGNKTEHWTLYPRGGEHATTIDITCSGIRIGDTGSENPHTRIGMLVEAEMLQNKKTLNDRMVRSIELLKHIPVAVSQFTMDGSKLIYQNPKASQLFGIPPGHESSTTDLNYSNSANPSNDETDIPTNHKEPLPLDESRHEPYTSTTPVNELLDRFVDADLGKNAIAMIAEKDEEFSAEVQLYTTTTTTTTATTNDVSSERQTNTRRSRNRIKNDSQSPQQYRWFNVSLRKTRDPVTSDFVILYIARDISDIVKARKDSIRAAMKSEFLDVMAHEIRTPLHQIVGHTDLLDDTSSISQCTGGKNPLNNEQLASVRQIQSSCSMLISIINDLLDCSKLENGQVLKEEIQFDLDKLICSCIEAMRPQVQQKKGLQLSYHNNAKCDTTKLISDPNRLQQILHNLVSNAIKFSSVGSVTVTVQPFTTNHYNTNNVCINSDDSIDPIGLSESSSIETSKDGSTATANSIQNEHHLLFEVTDTGIGIAPSEQSIVFERYRQANASVARNFGGTGLGLPICKGLVELLGGNIGLRSEVGIGTTVYFDIPFKIAPGEDNKSLGTGCTDKRTGDQFKTQNESSIVPPAITAATSISATTNLTGLNILVVEDNLINQKVVKAMLQRLGHVAAIADNGESALTLIREKQFHLILMDIQMPIMDGIDCTKHIRNVLQYDKDYLPIIGLTAGYQPSERDYYVNEIGMNACLGKPLPMNKLKEAIETYCHRQSNQQNAMDVNTELQSSNLSSSTSYPVAIGSNSLIATHKRGLVASKTPFKQSMNEKQQHQSNGMVEPVHKKKR